MNKDSRGSRGSSSAELYWARQNIDANPLIDLGAREGKPERPAYSHKEEIFEGVSEFEY